MVRRDSIHSVSLLELSVRGMKLANPAICTDDKSPIITLMEYEEGKSRPLADVAPQASDLASADCIVTKYCGASGAWKLSVADSRYHYTIIDC